MRAKSCFQTNNYKITVDQKNKLVKNVWSGKVDLTTLEEGCQSAENALKQFNKGEPVMLSNTTDVDMRFFPPGADKVIGESTVFCLSYCKTFAQVMSSLMLEKQIEKVQAGSNFRIFDSEQAAMKWLMEE